MDDDDSDDSDEADIKYSAYMEGEVKEAYESVVKGSKTVVAMKPKEQGKSVKFKREAALIAAIKQSQGLAWE